MVSQELKFNNLLSRILLRPRPALQSRGYKSHITVKNAAVLILIVNAPSPYILLTQRTKFLKHHANQVCLPGGKQDDNENLFETAIRETNEELGINLDKMKLLTQMESIETPSGYHITPFIGYVKDGIRIKHNPFEVQNVLKLTVNELLNKEIQIQKHKIGPHQHKVLSLSHQQLLIWGATAAILDQFKRWII